MRYVGYWTFTQFAALTRDLRGLTRSIIEVATPNGAIGASNANYKSTDCDESHLRARHGALRCHAATTDRMLEAIARYWTTGCGLCGELNHHHNDSRANCSIVGLSQSACAVSASRHKRW